MDKIAAIGIPPLKTITCAKEFDVQSKTAKTILLSVTGCLLVLFALWMISGLVYEGGRTAIISLDQPIEGFALDAETLDGCLRKLYPDDCASKVLTDVHLIATVSNQRMQQGTLELSYYEYRNELCKGGSIATVVFSIDPVSERIKQVERYSGAGKGSAVYQEPILDKTADFPLDWYVKNIAALLGCPSDQQEVLYVRNTKWGIRVRIRDDAKAEPVRYQENVVDWDASAGPEDRICKEDAG